MTHDKLVSYLNTLQSKGLYRTRKNTHNQKKARVTIQHKTLINFCSNDYLGLANHPKIAEAIADGAQRYGAGSGASHMISGHNQAHDTLEKALAKTQSSFIPNVKTLFFGTGYMANMAAITALSTLHNASGEQMQMSIFSEELNHASLIDGIRLASKQNQATIKIYPHQDIATLRKMLAEDLNPFKLIVTDAVFSMDGDIAHVDQLLSVAEEFNTLLMIDDAHGFGVLGDQGYGALNLFGISANDPRASRIIYMGTLGKAAGLSGAFVAGDAELIEWIMQKGRAYIYTTASPPLIAQGLLKSLELMSDPHHRLNLEKNITHCHAHLKLKKWRLMPSQTAIQPIVIGSNADALKVAQHLDQRNIWVPAIRPPTVPEGTARLRVTLSATHTADQIDQLIQALHEIEDAF